MTIVEPDYLSLAPRRRITAKQAAERMALGLKCRWCEAANKKLKPAPRGLVGYGCAGCISADKKRQSYQRKDAYQRKVYGITLEEKQRVLDSQDGGCICAPWTGYDGSSGRDLSTDHDHRTGEVRGILCKHCNDLLGRVRDDPAYFRMMILYLTDPPARRVLGTRVVPE